MRRQVLVGLLLAAGTTSAILAARPVIQLRAALIGWNEVPSVSTAAAGKFDAEISSDGESVAYSLEYADLQGTVTQAHIHVADVNVNGGISVWLCSNLTSPPTPPGVQPCPPPPARIEGTFTAASVSGPAAQGFAAGDYEELVEAIRLGLTYANVHSTVFPGGEVRGQIRLHPPGQAHD